MYLLLRSIISFLLLLIISKGYAQPVDSSNMPTYLKTRITPGFKLLKMDSSTYFYKYQLKKNTPTIIVYFNPDCDHCQIEAKKMVDSAKYIKKAQVVFVSSAPFIEIKKFATDYKLHYIKNCTVGRDEKYYISKYFRIGYTPYVAMYDGSGNLIQTFEGGTSVAQLQKLL